MASSSWCRETDEKINYTKLCRLLVDGGTQAVCSVFDGIHPPSSLKAILNANKTTLQTLKKPRGKVLNNDQWDKLYPASGSDPKSEEFDITLLFVLLRNICGLTPPATGWDVLPPGTDTSQEANLARIKYYRNNRLAHKPNTEINDFDFEQHWQDISSALLSLGLSQGDIDDLKSAPLGKKDYKQLLYDWYMSDEDIKTQLDDVKAYTVEIKSDAVDIKEKVDELHKMQTEAWKHNNPVNNLFMDEFTGNIKSLCERYAQSTRLWVLDQVKSHVNVDSDQPDSCIMLITAGPGMGKSTIAAKICQTYKDLGCLAGCHFFQFSNSTRNNPKLMIQSIARQMCDTVPGYREVLESKLRTKLGKTLDDMNCEELFTVLLEEPCHKLKLDRGSFVVVLDAIDECCSSLKQELQDILKNKLPFLPSWLRLVITTRPPPSFNALTAKQSIFIDPTDPRNQHDIKIFFEANLKNTDSQTLIIEELVKVSHGLFLVAFFLIDEIQKERISSPSELMGIFPRGLSSVYEKYFERLRTVLLPYITEEGFFKMLEAIVASKNPIPVKMMYSILGLKNATEVPHKERKARRDALSQLHSLFPVENDHVSTFHKSVIDFLIIEESEQDFNTSAKKMSKEKEEKFPDAAENLQGTSGISDASSHVEGKSVGTQNKERDQNNFSNTVHTGEPSKDHDFGVHVDDGNKVLIDHCYEVLGDIMQEKKDLNKPLDLTDSEKYALDFVWNFLKSSNDRRFFNYFLISALLCYRQYENGNIQSQTYHSEVDDPFHRVVLICARFFLVHLRHEKGCPFAQPLNFGRYVEFVLQIVIQNQIDKETATELLQKYKLSYCQYKVVDVHKEFHDKQSSISNLGCGNEFVVIQHTAEPNTVVTKYQEDGTVLFQESFPGKRNVYVSPNHLFIVVVNEPPGTDIEIRNAKTMEPVKSYPSPNVIRSCHMFGDHPWYIVARCYNNKVYVMEGETGAIVSTIAGIGQYVEVEAVSHLGHILLGTSNRYRNGLFTDEDGNFLEEMEWHNDKMVFGLQRTRQYSETKNKFYQRKLFLCHYKKPEEKIPIYPTKSFIWCCTSNSPNRSRYGYGESVCFSPDGSLLAFHYEGSIFIRKTSDGSLYKRVYLGPNHFDIFDHRGILLVTEDHVVVYGSWFNENAIMIINLHTNNIEHIYCCTSELLLFHPKTNDQPFRLITNRHSENECKVHLGTLHNLDL